MRPSPLRRSALPPASLALLVAACSSSVTPAGVSPAEIEAFSRATNIIPVEITVGGATGMAMVDTGNPFVLLNPSTFPAAATLPANGGDVPSIVVGSQIAQNVYVIPSSAGLTSPDPALPLGANLGCTAICSFVASLNYRDVTFEIGSVAPTPPAGLLPESVLDFSLAGGSQVDGVTLPRSRIVVTVTIEGTDHTMIVDTGASYVTISQGAFTAITSDGRAQLSGGTAETTSGASSTSMTRVAKMVVGGVEVDSVVVAHDTSFDTNLQAISNDAGQTIDGSLGGTFLHDFYVTIDYPSHKLHLARYANVDFALDPAERLGIQLAQANGGYVVASASSTAAAKGVTPGDSIVAIDQVTLGGLTIAELSVLPFGKVGTTKLVSFGAAAKLAGQTVPVPIEELLPLP